MMTNKEAYEALEKSVKCIEVLDCLYHCSDCSYLVEKEQYLDACRVAMDALKKSYTKADYIMALHKEYGCDFTRAEKAHQKALEYLRDTALLKG